MDRASKIGRPDGERIRPRDEISRGQCTGIKRIASGPIFERWEFQYRIPGASRYVLTATFYRGLPQIEFTASLDKLNVRDPEGMYVYFPLVAKDGVWYLDKPGTAIRPGIDQLPKACCDYYCIQHGAALAGKMGGVIYTTLDAPLIHLRQTPALGLLHIHRANGSDLLVAFQQQVGDELPDRLRRLIRAPLHCAGRTTVLGSEACDSPVQNAELPAARDQSVRPRRGNSRV